MTEQVNVLRAHLGALPVGEVDEVPASYRDTIPHDCLLSLLGIVLTHAGPGAARATMTVDRAHLNQRGVMQGGAVVALADAAAGWATYPAVAEGARFTTLEFKANLLGAGREGDTLTAIARPVHLGRRTMVLDVDVLQADQEERPPDDRRLIARFSCTQMILAE